MRLAPSAFHDDVCDMCAHGPKQERTLPSGDIRIGIAKRQNNTNTVFLAGERMVVKGPRRRASQVPKLSSTSKKAPNHMSQTAALPPRNKLGHHEECILDKPVMAKLFLDLEGYERTFVIGCRPGA